MFGFSAFSCGRTAEPRKKSHGYKNTRVRVDRALEIEKQKSEKLLYAMLPTHVANQLKEGKKVEAGEFKVCTILFSDVVTFTNICAACEPIQIVNMLNSMYSRFDRLTNIHTVYKVETIGDAYMVVGGVPIPTETHAERVANFALGMRIAAREVTSPITGQPIQIRVGLHTGPVLAGVVGDKMPRYCLFGDTVNTASRMESHGVPDHIHVSPITYSVLKDKGIFEIAERGEIEVKGKGLMRTYFLLKNLQKSDEQIMGLVDGETCVYQEDTETEVVTDDSKEESHEDANYVQKEDKKMEEKVENEKSQASSSLQSGEMSPYHLIQFDVTPAYDIPTDFKHLHNGLHSDSINTKFCSIL